MCVSVYAHVSKYVRYVSMYVRFANVYMGVQMCVWRCATVPTCVYTCRSQQSMSTVFFITTLLLRQGFKEALRVRLSAPP